MRRSAKHSALFSFLLVLLFSCEPQRRQPVAPPQLEEVAELFETPEEYSEMHMDSSELLSFLGSQAVSTADSADILHFYVNRSLQFAWFSADSLSDAAGNFLSMFSILDVSTLDTLGSHSLLTKRVQEAAELDRGAGLSAEEKLELELDLTAQFFRQANREYSGHVNADLHELDWYIPRRKKDFKTLLDSLVAGKNDLSVVEPVNWQYRALKKELKRLYALAEFRDSVELYAGEGIDLMIGDSSSVLPIIRERLFELGDMRSIDTLQIYDSTLYTGVQAFRARTGLSPIENINSYFIEELEIPISHRIKSILINMERCRWLPERQPPDMIFVNIPEFNLHMFEGGELIWDMDVVVGKNATRTSIFSGEMDRVVFSPYWNVPSSITNGEILPKLKKDPSYLRRKNFELRRGGKTISSNGIDWKTYETSMPYQVRQRPGGSNALGKVKFLFPNEYAIYLHDTPSKSKFKRTQRAFSHGCIRLSDPAKLAAYLLRADTAWTADSIHSAMNANKQKLVMLEEPIPVVLAYLTAWVDPEGTLNFREDIYKLDERLGEELFGTSLSEEVL